MGKRRHGTLEDLIELASRLPWALSLTLSVVVYVALTLVSRHYSASATFAPPQSNIPTPLENSLYGTIALILRWPLAIAFVIGAGMSWWKNRHRASLLSRANESPSEIEHLSWRDFERLVGQAYRQQGYSVTELGGHGPDGGVDLILNREGRETLVQCKQWRARRVGVRTIRELHGVMAHRRAAVGIVVTLGGFTAEAEGFARSSNIALLDRDALEALLSSVVAADPAPDKASRSSATIAPACPSCGSTMVQRIARQGSNKGQASFHYTATALASDTEGNRFTAARGLAHRGTGSPDA